MREKIYFLAKGNFTYEAPKPVKEKVAKAEAEELKAKLEEAGAQVELK